MRYILFTVLGLLLIIGGLAFTKFSQISMLIGAGKKMQAAGPPPETVSSVMVQKQVWESRLDAVATVVASKGVTLSNDAAGVVTRIHFESGATVQPGQVLLELDSNVERAQLASLRAKKRLAELSVARTRALADSGTIAPAQLDADEASVQGLSADEMSLVAQIARKSIRAPFAGKLGLRTVNLGQYLAPGTPVATLESTKFVFADFTVPQTQIAQLNVDAPVRAFADGATEPTAEGTISAIEPNLNATTRNVKVRASLGNDAGKLRHGMFLRVAVLQPEKREVTAIPTASVVHASYGDSVYCIESKTTPGAPQQTRKVARQQFVKVGEARGDYMAVLDGLAPGQEIVSGGAFKLRNGIPVAINNDVALNPQLMPSPANR
ncbi:MAG TPA: efflux RND transporter periplasmic adaptor subunit [Polyangiaceae bacterium]